MTYEEYYNQWQLSTESRDLAFDEWLCLMLDRQKAIDDTELHQRFEKVLNGQKWDLIDEACECFELAEDWQAWASGDFEYAKEYFRKVLEESLR